MIKLIKDIMVIIFGGMIGGICSIVFLDISKITEPFFIGILSGTVFTITGALGCYSIYLGKEKWKQ